MEPGVSLPCPSKLTLERYELGELPPARLTALHAHLRQCERCRQRLQEMDSQGAGYRRTLSALNTRHALHKADARWWRRAGLWVATPALACALVALVVLGLPRLQHTVLRSSQRVQARTVPLGERVVEPRPDTSPRKRLRFVDLHGERVEFGQGSLEGAPDGGPARPFLLRHTEVDAEITGFVSDVTVTQEFENPFTARVEAVYVFPLPDNAAVHEMTLEVGGRKIRGVIQRREEARRTYEQARSEGRHAALLDQERPNIFTQSVANILPGERVKVSLRYVATLDYDDGTFEFNFPMVVGPRYMPGQPLGGEPQGSGTAPDTDRVQDASRISPPVADAERSGQDVQVTVRLDAGVELSGLESISHRLRVDQRNTRQAVIRLAAGDRIPNKDFILRYRTAGEQLRGAVMATGGRDGYFALMLQPAEREAASDEVMPRDVIFVLDTSGSMYGTPLQAAKRAVRRAFESLTPNDRFTIINFAEDAASFRDTPLPATPENLELAQSYLDALSTRGGTNQLAGIERALRLPREEGRLRVVLLMTDGFIGNEAEIFARTEPLLGDTRLFGFGVGNNVNHYFLDRLSRIGRGFYQHIRTDEDPEPAIERFIRRIERPVLTHVQVDWGGLDVRDVQPERLPDLFDNQPLIVLGRYQKPGTATVRVRGLTPSGEHVTDVSVTLPEEGGHARALRTLWARSRIEELDMQRALDPREDTAERIAALGLEYQLVTAFTSFVAVDEAGTATTEGSEQSVVVPTGLSQGAALPVNSFNPAPTVFKSPPPPKGLPMPHTVDAPEETEADPPSGVLDQSTFMMGPTPDTESLPAAFAHPALSPDREMIAQAVKANIPLLNSCYETALKTAPGLAGRVMFRWTVSADGTVRNIRLIKSSLRDAKMEACIVERIKAWRLPSPTDGDTVVSFTFNFSPGKR